MTTREEENQDGNASDTAMECGKGKLLQRKGQQVSIHAVSDVDLPGKAHSPRLDHHFILLAHRCDRDIRQNRIIVVFNVCATRR